MINKFQQGGQALGSILALIQLLPEDLLKQILQAFSQWAQQKGINIQQLQLDPNALEQALGLFMQEMQQSAKHGAKLNYIKSLKHQCAEDEELYYFKKGGSLGCGCRKKEDGGEVTKAQKGTAVDKFKKRHIAEEDTIHTKKGIRDLSGKSGYPRFNSKEATSEEVMRASEKDYFAGRGDHSVAKEYPISERGKKPKTAKKENGGKAVKAFKEKCGSKLKKHFNGGSLNRIPFYLKGTPKKEPKSERTTLLRDGENISLEIITYPASFYSNGQLSTPTQTDTIYTDLKTDQKAFNPSARYHTNNLLNLKLFDKLKRKFEYMLFMNKIHN